jgi:predicted GNAT family N-acyltransferase
VNTEVIRAVKEHELMQAFSIRRKVFVEEQNVSEEEEYDEFERSAYHYLVLADGQPAGTARWRETSNGFKLERFAVLPEFRKAGVGSTLLAALLKDVPKTRTVYLHAQVPAMNLYRRQGFEPVGELFYECNIPHYKMILQA